MAARPTLDALTGFQDLEPDADDFRTAVLTGLGRSRKRLPSKFFYDEEGSRLFERICELEEYYLTRTEFAILDAHAAEIAGLVSSEAILIEFGSGSSQKVQRLLNALPRPKAYIPIDISREHLLASANSLARAYPKVAVIPVCADFVKPFDLPAEIPAGPRLGFFPGSTIGNFDPDDAVDLLKGMARQLTPDGALLIGADLKKDPAILHAAYNDADGITAAFNLNVLARINRELDGDFDLDAFAHRAGYNAMKGRIEMHLVSLAAQTVRVNGSRFHFRKGETIHTENSYKYRIDEFRTLAAAAGFAPVRAWTDARHWFSVHMLRGA